MEKNKQHVHSKNKWNKCILEKINKEIKKNERNGKKVTVERATTKVEVKNKGQPRKRWKVDTGTRNTPSP